MKLDSVRELKITAKAKILDPLLGDIQRRSLGVRTQRLRQFVQPETIALGISRTKQEEYVLAVRIQHPRLLSSPVIARLRDLARGETDVHYVGSIRKRQTPWYQQKCRPLRIGCSVGHVKVTAGTLGCFIRSRQDNRSMVLSNNHVLADENTGKVGESVLQPGRYDGGQDPADVVGTLASFIPLDFQNVNYFDCAAALLVPGLDVDASGLEIMGQLASATPVPVQGSEAVMKIGRTTGLTQGTVTAIELDNLSVEYDHGQARFDGQIEIEGAADLAFSQGGDSGSLVFDRDKNPIGLLFAGGDHGGSNSMGLTYANPLQGVLDTLAVHLLI